MKRRVRVTFSVHSSTLQTLLQRMKGILKTNNKLYLYMIIPKNKNKSMTIWEWTTSQTKYMNPSILVVNFSIFFSLPQLPFFVLQKGIEGMKEGWKRSWFVGLCVYYLCAYCKIWNRCWYCTWEKCVSRRMSYVVRTSATLDARACDLHTIKPRSLLVTYCALLG